MISARMSRPIKVLVVSGATIAIAALLAACGTEKISVPSSDPTHQGAVLFSQRCSGCHTLSYAATHGSAANVRTRLVTDGPNFNVRCERPITRVLYAIENGGFSGAVMPQNVVVGKDAAAVAEFVSKYAGRQAPKMIGGTECAAQPIGTLPRPTATIAAASPTAGSATTATATTSTTASNSPARPKAKAGAKQPAHH
jgi:mono/diheme cytochrome c family protein